MNKVDLRREVAELFIIRASGFNLDSQRLYPDLEISNSNLQRLLEEGVGGVIFFGGTIKELEIRCNVLKNWASKPLLLCADIEEGVGQRFYGGTNFIPPMGIAQIYKKDKNLGITIAEKIGYLTGLEAKHIGLNWLLAPVCDINSNSYNPVINLRAWGEDPETVKNLTCAYQRGASRSNILTCAKHFPGHGNTKIDSHFDLPKIYNNFSKINKFELIPFKTLINQGVNSVMIGHLFFPDIDPVYPATLSEKIINGLLRNQLKFDGLIVSDALVMKAISNKYSSGEAAFKAFNAGIDLILMPEDVDEAIDYLTEAFYTGKISLERLIRSKERRQRQIHLLDEKQKINSELSKPDVVNNKFLFQASEFNKSLIKKSIFIRKRRIIKVDINDINLVQIENFEQVTNKLIPALSLPEDEGFKNLIIHPLGVKPWHKDKNKFLELEQIGNGRILIQLFVRGKPFVGVNFYNYHWVDILKDLEIKQRLSGVVIYGCPYLFDKIKKSINKSIPLGYSPSQTDEAQIQVLSRILKSKINHN